MSESTDKSAGWVTFDPNLKIIDCTVRDGGLCNNHQFEDGFFKNIYDTCVAGGIDYMEVGYKADKKLFAGTGCGPWKYSDEEDIRRVRQSYADIVALTGHRHDAFGLEELRW